jgi:hypothetical protein
MINADTQAGRLLAHLQAGKTITRLQSFIELGIVELSSRCIEIEREGYKIDRKRVKVQNRFNETVSVTEYSIEVKNGMD